MLLGHDPVAYFARGRPERGDPSIRVDLPDRSYGFASAEHRTMFEPEPARYEPQYGGFRASGAAFAIKLGGDPTSWTIRDRRLFVFGDVLGQTARSLDPRWNVDHADRLWPSIRDRGWRAASLAGYADKVPRYKTGARLRAEFEARYPGRPFPDHDPGGMVTSLFLEPPGWRTAGGFGQPALGYPRRAGAPGITSSPSRRRRPSRARRRSCSAAP